MKKWLQGSAPGRLETLSKMNMDGPTKRHNHLRAMENPTMKVAHDSSEFDENINAVLSKWDMVVAIFNKGIVANRLLSGAALPDCENDIAAPML